MSTRPPNNSTGPLDHLSLRYLREALDRSHPADEPFVLNAVESRVIRRTKAVVLTTSAGLGLLFFLFFYWPQYNWPALFGGMPVTILGWAVELSLVTILYGLLLVYLEISLLLAINEWGVKMIMEVCQFPRAHDAQYESHVQSLADATLEESRSGFVRFGLDPYLTMPRWGLTIFFLLNIGKAALSALLLQVVLNLFWGQSLLGQTMELVCLPIYACWNVWSSWQVLHEAQVRVMAPTTIREFVHELHEEWGKNDQFSPLILEALQYAAILERPANYAHFLLTETIIDRFGLPGTTPLTGNFPEQVLQAPVAVRRSLERLIVFGSLVDGRLSWLEKQRLRVLRQKGFLTYSAEEIRRISTDYNQGRGLWV